MSKIKIEHLSHYAVIIIALSALFVSVWQVRISHQHNKLSVKPYLDFHLIQIDSTLEVSFSNEGFGPAIIKKIIFNHNGKEYESLQDLLVGTGEIENRLGSYNYSENTIIAGGDHKFLVKLKNRETRGIKVQIEYMTIYEEKGVFNFSF